MDVVSSHGYAWGYIGSCIPFSLSLLLVLFAGNISLTVSQATGIAFILNALWWLLLTIPLLKTYRQKHFIDVETQAVKEAFLRLIQVFQDIKQHKAIFTFLLAFFFYIDGVYTIIGLATSYGKDVGISDDNLLLALLLTQIIAFPCALFFGRLFKSFSTQKLINVCIIGYTFITAFALQLNQAWEFWFLAVCVAMFQGSIQALSRSYFAKLIPKNKFSEYFGFFDIFGKSASFMGTMIMGITIQLTGNSKTGVGAIIVLFIIGFIIFQKAAIMNQANISIKKDAVPLSE